MGRKIAFLDCHSGISGDMLLSALLDAGLPLEKLQQAVATLPVQSYQLEVLPVLDFGIRGSRLLIRLSEQERLRYDFSQIAALFETAHLSQGVKERALAVFRSLAEVLISENIETSHLDGFATVDAILTITGVAVAIEALDIAQLYASPLPLTSGHVLTTDGLRPVPSPTTLEILRRVRAPWKPSSIEGDLVTPIGAALLAILARFEMPALTIEQVGYGFGQEPRPWPHCVRLCLGEELGGADKSEGEYDWVTVIESHIDDMTGEVLGGVMERLFAAGALDVSYTPIQMKKNRPATRITIICTPHKAETLGMVLLRETSTLGLRLQQLQRLKAQRFQQQIATPFGMISVKVKRIGSRIISASPEYEDCLRLAKEQGRSLAEVYDVAYRVAASSIIGDDGEKKDSHL